MVCTRIDTQLKKKLSFNRSYPKQHDTFDAIFFTYMYAGITALCLKLFNSHLNTWNHNIRINNSKMLNPKIISVLDSPVIITFITPPGLHYCASMRTLVNKTTWTFNYIIIITHYTIENAQMTKILWQHQSGSGCSISCLAKV